MSTNILITGGKERADGFQLGEGKYYDEACLLKLDLETGTFERLLTISESTRTPENYPDEHPNLEFTAGHVDGDTLWLCTDTEVMQYAYPEMKLLKKASLPAFHNIHHVRPFEDYVAVVSTGLDMIVLLSPDTLEPIEYLNVEGKDPWHRFSPDVDYRKIHSTRPHDGHPNFVFKLGEELWVTRCTQEDAVCLSDMSKLIDIAPPKEISVHDGHVIDGRIYFTTVDGFIVIADASTLKVIEEFDINKFEERAGSKGWCRGIHLDGDILYVGFTRFRRTRNKKKIAWVKDLFDNRPAEGRATVAAYDLKRKEKLQEWVLPENTIDAIYSLLPEPK